jgi:hypothetical protein
MAGESIETGEVQLSREQMVARDRAAFLAGDEAEEAVEEKPSGPQTQSTDEEDDEDEAEKPAVAAAEDDSDDEDEDDEKEESDDDDDDDDDLDEPGAKAMAQVRKAEKRMRERFTAERQAFERERQQWQDEIKDIAAAAKKFERLQQRAKYEPDMVLAELGLTDDDFDFAHRKIFARTKTAAADPKWREATERMAKDRELADRVAATEKANEQLREELRQARATEQAEREGKAYLDSVVKAADDSAPLLKRQLEKNPTKAHNALAAIAVELFDKHGVQPAPAKVIKVYEKRRRAELEELGVEVPAVTAKAKTAAAKKPVVAAAASTSKRPTREEILAELHAGKFE